MSAMVGTGLSATRVAERISIVVGLYLVAWAIPSVALAHDGEDLRLIDGPFSAEGWDWSLWSMNGPLAVGDNQVAVSVADGGDLIPALTDSAGNRIPLVPWNGHDGYWMGDFVIPEDSSASLLVEWRRDGEVVTAETLVLEAWKVPAVAKVILVAFLAQAVLFGLWLLKRMQRTWRRKAPTLPGDETTTGLELENAARAGASTAGGRV